MTPDRYCSRCGTRLTRVVRWTGRYEYTTGEKEMEPRLVCPRSSRWRFWESHLDTLDTTMVPSRRK